MKLNGIVRKLDMLGRIVIPREYRKMLNIKENDPLEIISTANGDIIIRKVDISSELVNAGRPIADELFVTLNRNIMVCDTAKYLTGAGTLVESLCGTVISSKAQQLIEKRDCFVGKASEIGMDGAPFVAICPVYSENVFGALVLFSDTLPSAHDTAMLQLVGRILGNTLQNF
ncbi:MAG: AbrB/MazE/SpoVT family DNA-binding domain-containing protein [Firmicutes bacterium]|nr:AbrB/MazE/SpoVT family DNA-binding domain-containing protein [Bacillota bacterium]